MTEGVSFSLDDLEHVVSLCADMIPVLHEGRETFGGMPSIRLATLEDNEPALAARMRATDELAVVAAHLLHKLAAVALPDVEGLGVDPDDHFDIYQRRDSHPAATFYYTCREAAETFTTWLGYADQLDWLDRVQRAGERYLAEAGSAALLQDAGRASIKAAVEKKRAAQVETKQLRLEKLEMQRKANAMNETRKQAVHERQRKLFDLLRSQAADGMGAMEAFRASGNYLAIVSLYARGDADDAALDAMIDAMYQQRSPYRTYMKDFLEVQHRARHGHFSWDFSWLLAGGE